MLQMITYMGIVLYAPALALSAVTSLPKWTSVIVVGMVCTLYCATGGIKAVLWTDVFQSVLMFLCLSLMAIVGTCNVGGLYKVIEVSIRGDRLTGPNLSFDPTERHTLWSLMFGGIFIYLSLYGVNQTQVQRLLTVRSLSAAQKCLWMSWPLTTVLSLLTCFTGLVMYANYADCDPLLSGRIRRRDQLVPFFMMQLFHAQPGLAGVVIAGIFAGSLSTVSSFVNSLAAVSLHDLIRPLVTQHSFDRHSLIYTKLLACFYGLLCLLVAYLAEQVSGLLEASLSIFSLVGGPLLGVFTLGMCSSRCTGRAALVALLVSLGFGLWMCLGAHFASISPPLLVQSISGCSNITFSLANTNSVPVPTTQLPFYLYRISYMWVAAITFIVAIVTGVSISFAFSPKLSQQIDPRLLSSFVILDFVVSKSKPKSSVQLQDCTTY